MKYNGWTVQGIKVKKSTSIKLPSYLCDLIDEVQAKHPEKWTKADIMRRALQLGLRQWLHEMKVQEELQNELKRLNHAWEQARKES